MKRVIFFVFVCCLSFSVLAQSIVDPNKYSTPSGHPDCRFFDGFIDKGDGTVFDPRSSVIWKRCAEGYNWNGSGCVGVEVKLSWYDAMLRAKNSRFLGKDNWRLPTAIEIDQVVGGYKSCNKLDYKKNEYAASRMIAHPVKKEGGSGSYWSSSPSSLGILWAIYIDFDEGFSGSNYRWGEGNVRLVRDSGFLWVSNSSEFIEEYAKIGRYKKEIEEVLRKEKKEIEEKAENERRSASYGSSPAGQAETKRALQARQLCEAQKQTCIASCPQYDANRDNYAAHTCYFRCTAISCD